MVMMVIMMMMTVTMRMVGVDDDAGAADDDGGDDVSPFSLSFSHPLSQHVPCIINLLPGSFFQYLSRPGPSGQICTETRN